MPLTREIAEVLWARCLEAEHKPGRVQFTKYLYLIDYCHWRFHGHQASDAQWIFYHYGPWAPEADAAMDALAMEYGFSWGEEEETVLRFVRVDEPRGLEVGLEAIIQHVLKAFKNLDLNRVLEFAYNQTEPMLSAKRGEHLDFRTVPVDQTMPVFVTSAPARTVPSLHPNMSERIAAFRAKASKLRTQAEQRRTYRESDEYKTARRLLADEVGTDWRLPDLRARLSDESVASLGR